MTSCLLTRAMIRGAAPQAEKVWELRPNIRLRRYGLIIAAEPMRVSAIGRFPGSRPPVRNSPRPATTCRQMIRLNKLRSGVGQAIPTPARVPQSSPQVVRNGGRHGYAVIARESARVGHWGAEQTRVQ